MGVGVGVSGPAGVGAGDGIVRLGGHGAAEIRGMVHGHPEIGEGFGPLPAGAVDGQRDITHRDGGNSLAEEGRARQAKDEEEE